MKEKYYTILAQSRIFESSSLLSSETSSASMPLSQLPSMSESPSFSMPVSDSPSASMSIRELSNESSHFYAVSISNSISMESTHINPTSSEDFVLSSSYMPNVNPPGKSQFFYSYNWNTVFNMCFFIIDFQKSNF